MTPITVQAATNAALVTLLLQHDILVVGEGGTRPATGITYSNIGEASLDGTKLSGFYAFIGLDETVLGEVATQSLITALSSHTYTGPDLRLIMGVSNYNPDIPQQIRNERDRRLQNGGCKVVISGVDKWFHSDDRSQLQQISLLMLGAGISSVPPWKTMDGSRVTLTAAIAQQIFASAVTQAGATHEASDAGIAAYGADPGAFSVSSIQWPAVYAAA
jgi:Domain of unknown function (DUF4376)